MNTQDTSQTLRSLFEEYINECKFSARLRSETIRGYIAVFNLFTKIMPEVGTVDLLSTNTLTEFFKRIETRQRIVGKNTLKTGVKTSIIKTQWTKLNVFFKWLKENGHITHNPLTGIKPPRVNYDDFKRLNDTEARKIYSAIILNSRDLLLIRRDTLMISLLLYLGLRRGELLALRVCDLDLHNKRITIQGETSKSGKSRVLTLHPTLIMHLKEYLNERNKFNYKTEYLIVSGKTDRGLSKDGLMHWVKSLIKRPGVKFHLHQFRHTFACKLVESEVNAFSIQKLMGHTRITMTVKYLRSLNTEDMGEDLGRISF